MTAAEMLPHQPRDLTDPEVWQRSRWRANARREAAATDFEFRTPSPRGMSLAALFAIVGVPAVSLGTSLVDTPEAEAKPAVRHSGGGVKKLQRALGIPADGVFGPQTARALRRWQRAHGMTADGIAGPATRSALGIGAGPVLKRKGGGGHGSRTRKASSRGGGGVAALQRALGVGSDGVFGPQTESALKRWQARHGLVADGVAGPATRRALGLGPGKLLKRGARGGGGNRTDSMVQRVIAAGNRIAHKPYKYGGGHGTFRDSGYDCSGSVSYALHGAGLLKVPRDSGGFTSYGRPGRGKHITIYANAGHVYMTVDGRRFDTSATRISGSRWTSVGRSSSGYVVRHPAGL